MRFIRVGDSFINMDLVSRYYIIEESSNKIGIFADGDLLFELGSRWEAERMMEKIIDFSAKGNGVFNPTEDEE